MDTKEKDELLHYFRKLIEDENISYAIAAMKALMRISEKDSFATTMQEFIAKIRESRQILQAASPHISVRSGCELIVRFMTFSHPELEQASDFNTCRNILMSRGQSFVEKMEKSREQVIDHSKGLIKNDMVILTHSRSRNVLAAMIKASQSGIQFKVYVTEAQPTCEGMTAVLKHQPKYSFEAIGLKTVSNYSICSLKEPEPPKILMAPAPALGLLNMISLAPIPTPAPPKLPGSSAPPPAPQSCPEVQQLSARRKMCEMLQQHNIPCTVILDCAVAYIIEKIDAVLLGAEGVCENGGIINRVGTCNVATLANLKEKPVYVLVESYKFIRLIPLNNSSLPKEYLFPVKVLRSGVDLEKHHPLVDYTSPLLITLLYTDLGILPTSAVTEHLIKLYT